MPMTAYEIERDARGHCIKIPYMRHASCEGDRAQRLNLFKAFPWIVEPKIRGRCPTRNPRIAI